MMDQEWKNFDYVPWKWIRIFVLWFGAFCIFFLQRNFADLGLVSFVSYGIWTSWILILFALIGLFLRNRSKKSLGALTIYKYQIAEFLFFIIALALYFSFVQESSWFSRLMLGKALLLSDVLFVSLFAFALLFSVGFEFSLWRESQAPRLNLKEIKHNVGLFSKLATIFSAILFFNVAAYFWNFSWDGSFFKSSSPSASTLEIMRKLAPRLSIKAFFSQDNEMKSFITSYCVSLEARLREIRCEFIDKDLRPDLAEEYQVSRDGQIIFVFEDGRRERLDFGTNLQAARQEIRNIDLLVQKVGLSLLGKKKRIYFTRGHGELVWGSLSHDPLFSLNILEKFLRDQNYEIAWFSKVDGKGSNEIPSDADLVITLGADQFFLESEVKAISDYLLRGGAYLLMLDHPRESSSVSRGSQGLGDSMNHWLNSVGIEVLEGVLSNDRQHIKISGSPSDRWWVVSNVFLEHPITQSLRNQQERNAVILSQAKALRLREVKDNPWVLRDILRSSSESYLDINKNFKLDAPPETLDSNSLMVLATRDVAGTGALISNQAKWIVLSDASILSDALIRNNGNINLVANTFRWILGNDFSLGEVKSDEDIRILHTHREDLLYFYLSIFGVPLLLLLVGWVALRKDSSKSTNQ